ncbi:hypothetical protein RAB80_009075 [Fusarium oxysporum f. sp. vasinfectum]|nr:hypothetical protein RAB80_009075 [Fusarium oxysporum f. sp. vasinfectum]KAK2930528.1 hypothetical protein FoTM2_008038 [Fusarium oxysporum f. sp. vasinfectum]
MPLQPAGTPTSPIRVDAPPSPSPPENKTSKVILPHAAAWKAAYESMYTLLNETDPTKQNNLTQKWIRNMQQHLNITIITVGAQAYNMTLSMLPPPDTERS